MRMWFIAIKLGRSIYNRAVEVCAAFDLDQIFDRKDSTTIVLSRLKGFVQGQRGRIANSDGVFFIRFSPAVERFFLCL